MMKGIKKSKGSSSVPVTAQDFLEKGVEEEDHGDRWIGSGDVAKAVRFYQRANGFYRRAIGLDGGGSWISKDAVYNSARMQYLIFSRVVKNGLLDEIRSSLEVETVNESVIVEDIISIVNVHEQALALLQNASSIDGCVDLLYNYAQVLVDAGEEREEPQWFIKAGDVFDKVLNDQIKRVVESEGENDGEDEDEDEDGESRSKPTKSVLLETQISFLQCLTSLIEFSRDEKWAGQIHPSIEIAKIKAIELKDQILQLINDTSFTTSPLSQDQIDDAFVSIAKYASSLAQSFDELRTIWSDEALPNTPHRFLSQADSLLDMQELIPANAPDDALLWSSYSLAASVLAKAPQPANTSVLTKRKILLIRGDIDWLRGQLNTPAAIKNRDTLLRNAKVYYQNAINIPSLAPDLDNELVIREASVKKQLLEGTPPTSKSLDHILNNINQQGLRL